MFHTFLLHYMNRFCRDDAPSRCGRKNFISKRSRFEPTERSLKVCVSRQMIVCVSMLSLRKELCSPFEETEVFSKYASASVKPVEMIDVQPASSFS